MTDILSGIRVVELAAWTFVPAAGAVLADWGADVIKIEHPETGDPQRGLISSGIVAGAGGVNHFIEPRIDMVSFTGSTAVGKLIARLSGETMKRNLLELGGKSAYVVLDDADMDVALPGCIAALIHSGQGCALTTRMLVPRQFYEPAVDVVTSIFAGIAVGDPAIPAISAARWCRPSSVTAFWAISTAHESRGRA